MSNKFLLQMKGKPYLELVVISGDTVLKRVYIEDRGQEIDTDKGLDMAFIIPDRKYGLRHGRGVTFFYNCSNVVPLSMEEEGKTRDSTILYQEVEGKKIDKVYVNTGKRQVLESTYIEPSLLKRFIDTKIVGDLLKPVDSPFEALVKPIMFIGALLFVGYLIYILL